MSFFNSITDHLLDTSERIIKVVEEGSTILLGGTMSQSSQDTTATRSAGSSTVTTGAGAGAGADDLDGILDEEFLKSNIDMESPLNGIADGVLSDIMKSQVTPTTIMEHIQAFKSAINWNEPFIIAILAFHILMSFLTFIILKHGEMKSRLSILVIISILVQCAQSFNTWASDNWETFATQNYFDDSGVFVTLMWSTPLLLMTFCMLIAYLREASSLLVQVKRKELSKKKNGGRIDPVTGKIIGGGSSSGSSGGSSGGKAKSEVKKTNKNKRRSKKSPKED